MRQSDLTVVLAIYFLWALPYLIPTAFLAFTVWKRRFSIAAILWLTTSEAVAIWLSLWLPNRLAELLPPG